MHSRVPILCTGYWLLLTTGSMLMLTSYECRLIASLCGRDSLALCGMQDQATLPLPNGFYERSWPQPVQITKIAVYGSVDVVVQEVQVFTPAGPGGAP
jgi:hypothetical protein